MANGDIELKYKMLVTGKRNGVGVIPARFFIILAAIFLYWFTQKYQLVDRSITFIGCAVIPFSVYFFMKHLKPLVLHSNGDITITSTVGPAVRFVHKSKIAAYSTLRHYGGLKEVRIDEEKAIFDSRQPQNRPEFGNPLFYFVCLVLVAVVVINIYVSYQNP